MAIKAFLRDLLPALFDVEDTAVFAMGHGYNRATHKLDKLEPNLDTMATDSLS